MGRTTEFTKDIRGFWVRYRWIILALAVFTSAMFEFYELLHDKSILGHPIYILEIMLQGGVIPALLILIQRTETQKNLAKNSLSLRDALTFQLNNAQNWDELIEVIGQFPRNFLPLSGISVLIQSPSSNRYIPEFVRIIDSSLRPTSLETSLDLSAMTCHLGKSNAPSKVSVCNCRLSGNDAVDTTLHRRYCLQLVDSDSMMGVLHLYLPVSYKLSKGQVEFLESVIPEITLSLRKVILRRKDELLEAAIETERLHLASDLHDTLGQDLAYLGKKIDYLLTDQSIHRSTKIMKELYRMRTVIDEANRTVRNIVAVAHGGQNSTLDSRLLAYARAVGARSNLEVSLEMQGQPLIPDQYVQFQIFLIFREIMINIEKHAQASQVLIKLIWAGDALTLEVSDNGNGFNKDLVNKGEHYGLTIIETRTRELNGHLSIDSEPGRGARISVCLPLSLVSGLPNYEKNLVG
jgi:signal transduction histidine kinase